MNLVMMRNLILFLLLGSIGCVSGKSCELRVFQLNIWGDATVVPGAFDAAVLTYDYEVHRDGCIF